MEKQQDKVTIYSRNSCMPCFMTKKFLEDKGVPFTEYNLDENPEKEAEAKATGFKSAPIVIPVGNEPAFCGFRPDMLGKIA